MTAERSPPSATCSTRSCHGPSTRAASAAAASISSRSCSSRRRRKRFADDPPFLCRPLTKRVPDLRRDELLALEDADRVAADPHEQHGDGRLRLERVEQRPRAHDVVVALVVEAERRRDDQRRPRRARCERCRRGRARDPRSRRAPAAASRRWRGRCSGWSPTRATMARMATTEPTSTANQPPPLAGYNLYEQDAALVEGVRREGGGAVGGRDRRVRRGARRRAARVGAAGERAPARSCGRTTATASGSTRSSSTPPGTRSCGSDSRRACSRCRGSTPRPGAHVARAALFMLLGQVEAGVGCPLSMTFASVPALRTQPELAEEWIPRLTSGDALCGMAMTERQGGSDVRANETTARPDGDALGARRPQVVLLGADERRVPRARAGAGRALLLPARAAAARASGSSG